MLTIIKLMLTSQVSLLLGAIDIGLMLVVLKVNERHSSKSSHA